ncbi:MAG: precorrin-2 dehydrogenase/sirohydrochlorin ferrochelatase family protein [Bacillota bacterium]|jgi:precorrin-2 dehydrogenase/sirohydrochlorin ferrochelatase
MTKDKNSISGKITTEEQKNGHFPIFLEIKAKKCLIIGGGEVAAEKAAVLKSFGAEVVILNKTADEYLKNCRGIRLLIKNFEDCDLDGCTLAIVADPHHPDADRIAAACRDKRIPVTFIDNFAKGDFIFPYIFQNGCITTAVSSGGQNPALAMSTKKMFEAYTPDYYEVLSESMKKCNSYLKNKVRDSKIRKKIYNELFDIGKSNHGIITEEHL